MKKILYSLILIVSCSFILFSCDEEIDYKSMNTTHLKEQIEIKELVGDLTSEIVIKNLDGEVVDNVDMGETFYLIDNSMEGVTDREWTFTQNGKVTKSTDKLVSLNFAKPGPLSIDLTSSRSSDNKTVSTNQTVDINKIPVFALFETNPAPENDIITINRGESIDLLSASKGSPSVFEWVGKSDSHTIKRTGAKASMQFKEIGTYDITLTAKREDQPGVWEEGTKTVNSFVQVLPIDMRLVRGVATDNNIKLWFGYAVQENLEEIKNAISLRIKTASNGDLIPKVVSIAAVEDDPTIVIIVMDNQMYSDDELFISVKDGAFKDIWGLTPVAETIDKPASYGHNMWDHELYGMEAGPSTWLTIDKPEVTVTNEKAYSGDYSVKLRSEAGKEWTDAEVQGEGRYAQLEAGKIYEMSWKMWIDPDNFHNVLGPWLRSDKGALQKQYWTGMNALPKGEWTTVKKTVNADDIKGDKNVHFHIRIKMNNIIYIDDVAIYEPNPRP